MILQGKVAIITGGARGIGRAIAERFSREGAIAVIADLNEAGVQAAAAEIGAECLGLALDGTRQDSIDTLVAAVVARYGRIDILVNNAGIFDLAPTVEITRASYQRVYAVNVEGLLFTLQAVARQMIHRAGAARAAAARSSTSPRKPAGGASRWWRSTARRRPRSSASPRAPGWT